MDFATFDPSCNNTINDDVFNRCMKQSDDSFLFLLANWIAQFINPRAQALSALAVLVSLPLLLLHDRSLHSVDIHPRRRTYRSAKRRVLHFLHRICFSLILDVVLYTVFRQHRPCKCNGTQVGSIYGMPSGDAMAGALLGAIFLDRNPFHPIWSRVAGLLIMVGACLERTTLGMHSVGQVLTGSTMGVLLHFYATRVPMLAVYIDTVVSLVLGAILLHVDPALVYHENDYNNLWAWFMWGVAFQVYVCIHLWRDHKSEQQRGGSLHGVSIFKLSSGAKADDAAINFSDAPYEEEELLTNGLSGHEEVLRKEADTYGHIIAMAALLALTMLSSLIERYGWMTKLRSGSPW